MAGSRLLRFFVALIAVVGVGLYAGRTRYRATTFELGGGAQLPDHRAIDGGPVRFLKGQTHAHSNASADSQTPPADVARWYAEHGFDFVVLTDHNVISPPPPSADLLIIAGVELTQNPPTCDPPPRAGMRCPLHVNALFVDPAKQTEFAAIKNGRRIDIYTSELEATVRLGGDAQINHPNFHYGADDQLINILAERGARFLEIANEASDSNNQGEAGHPSTEALWDQVLTNGYRIWGVASDDAHHYDDAVRLAAEHKPFFVGDKGFVMVRASKTEASIREAMRRGDFYASTGVILKDVRISPEAIDLELLAEGGPYEVQFVAAPGKVLAHGSSTHFSLVGVHGYIRAKVIRPDGAAAWTQPAFLD